MGPGEGRPSLASCGWLQPCRSAWPSLPHTSVHTSFFTSLHLLCTHWVLGPALSPGLTPFVVPKGQPHSVVLQAPRLVSGKDGRGRALVGRLERPCVSQQAADRQQRPLLAGSLLAHLAEQRQWWLPLQASLLPTGRAPGP